MIGVDGTRAGQGPCPRARVRVVRHRAVALPPGTRTGQPISPPGGYGFDGLVRNTNVQVDPSGNLWITNNWKLKARPLKNPGGYQMVVYIGVAGPVRTPLIGPPRAL